MKRTYKIFFMSISVFALLMAGTFSTMATSLETSETSEETVQDNSAGTEEQSTNASTEQSTSETEVMRQENLEDNTESTQITEDVTEISVEEEGVNNETTDSTTPAEGLTDTEETTENTEGELLPKEDVMEATEILDLEQLLSEKNAQTGLYYYLQKYQYDCRVSYMEKYVDYIEMQVSACKQMYELGDVAETVLKFYEAQKALAEADLQTAKNEIAYYNLYLEKNELDYKDYNIKEMKSVESIDYYIENYPEKDYMTLARYVTDYNNAVAEIEAKEIEITALERDVTIASLLLEEGEISKIECAEKEISLAQAKYELEQHYVSMNIAYYNLTALCQ